LDADHPSTGVLFPCRITLRSKNAALAFQYASFDLDVFVLTARFENEFVPIRKHLMPQADETTHPLWSDKIAFGEIKMLGKRPLRSAIACVGEMGMAATSAAATSAINVFRPRLISMLGMCCGFNSSKCASPQKLLDVIVARQVFCWEEGRFSEGDAEDVQFLNRAKPRLVDDRIRLLVEQLIERSSTTIDPTIRRLQSTSRFKEARAALGDLARPSPMISFGTMVSGSSVIAEEGKIEEILASHTSAIGLDMELFGLYTAVDRSLGTKPSVLGIRLRTHKQDSRIG
jgi:nucleoside phosphorylase